MCGEDVIEDDVLAWGKDEGEIHGFKKALSHGHHNY